MKTLFVLLGMFIIYPCLYAQDAELQACREELARGMSQKNRDSIAAAYCHFLQMGRPAMEKGYSSWKDFIAKNPDKVK